MRSACDNATCPNDDRFKMLLEQICRLEKDREIVDYKCASKVNRFGADVTNKREDHKPFKVNRRNLRSTSKPIDEKENCNSLGGQSPVANDSCADDVYTPGDDRIKDPDWILTSHRNRSNLHSNITFRKTRTSGYLRKTRSNSRLFSSVNIMSASSVDENKF